MASITIGNLEDGLKRRLRIRAAEHGRWGTMFYGPTNFRLH